MLGEDFDRFVLLQLEGKVHLLAVIQPAEIAAQGPIPPSRRQHAGRMLCCRQREYLPTMRQTEVRHPAESLPASGPAKMIALGWQAREASDIMKQAGE
jgi:hypothetical protein